jgi:formamidopyrimidine-DNA glycosylase
LPELPEVENIAAGLREAVLGRRIAHIDVRRPAMIRGPHRRRWRPFLQNTAGHTITRIARRAKRLIITTDNGLTLLFQLGMTGKFLVAGPPDLPADDKTCKHTQALLDFQDGARVRFVDVRRFGRLWLFDTLDPDDPDPAMDAAGMGPLGPEALSAGIAVFRQTLQTARPVKSLLLDQTRIAGLGNIYADEALFAARIHPARPSADIDDAGARRLLQEIKSALRRAIRAGGTTLSDYRTPYGDMGRFRRRLRVYRRHGQPCPRCATPIQRIVLVGRGTHFCPACQAAPKGG